MWILDLVEYFIHVLKYNVLRDAQKGGAYSWLVNSMCQPLTQQAASLVMNRKKRKVEFLCETQGRLKVYISLSTLPFLRLGDL